MADRIAVFDQGRIMQVGTPEDVYQRPNTRFVADFVGSSNVLEPAVALRLGAEARWYSLRPEDIVVGDGGGRTARVVSQNYLGSTKRVTLDVEGVALAAVVPASLAVPAAGGSVEISWPAQALHPMEGEE